MAKTSVQLLVVSLQNALLKLKFKIEAIHQFSSLLM